jgi:DNA repair exonuclease SbcCD nuclease subunit
MSIIYTISDTHLSNRKAFSYDVVNNEFPGTNNRFQSIILAIRTCAEQAIAAGAEALVLPGDIFNERGILPVAVYTAAYKTFQEISKKIPLIFTPGNHDVVSSIALHSNEGLHSLYGFKEFASVAHAPEHFVTDSFSISMVPFIPSKEGTIAASEKLFKQSRKEKDKFHLIFYHHSFDGAETGPINFKMDYALKYEDIPAFDGKYSGHLHKHQIIGPAKNGLVYVGAPVHHDVGERNYTPGWLSIDNKGGFTHIDNTVSPRFVVLETASEKEVKQLNKEDYKVVKWTGEEAAGYKIKESYPNIKLSLEIKAERERARSTISSTDSVENMARKYMVAKRGKVDEDLLKYGLDFWRNNET